MLVDGDDHNEPVADTIRGTLDGHIVLDRASGGPGTLSRRQRAVVDVAARPERLDRRSSASCVRRLRAMIARFEDTRDLRLMGGYQPGRDSELDQAVQLVPKIYDVMRQAPSDPASTEPFQELLDVIKTAIG